MYSKKVIEHFINPHHIGEIEDADAVGKAGNPRCGDEMKIFLKIKNNKIVDFRFKTYGCAAAIATTDILGDLVIGKSLNFAKDLSEKKIIEGLGELPPVKIHCANLAVRALREAIRDYEKNQKI